MLAYLPHLAAATLVAIFIYSSVAVRRANRGVVESYRRWLQSIGLSEVHGVWGGRVADAEVSLRSDHQSIRRASQTLRILTVVVTTDTDPTHDWWIADREVLERMVVTPPSLAHSVAPADDELARALTVHTNDAAADGPWQRPGALQRAWERGLVWACARSGRLEAHYRKAGAVPEALDEVSRLEVALYSTLRLSSVERDARYARQSHVPFREGAPPLPWTLWGFPFALLVGGVTSSENVLGLSYTAGWELFAVHAAAALVVALPVGAVLGALIEKSARGTRRA